MAAGLFGYFIFEPDVNKDINGGYINKHTPDLQTENGARKSILSPAADPFIGTFDTKWSDPGSKTAVLNIALTGKVYTLSWVVSPDEKYEGKGIVGSVTGRLDGF